jgi:hypothetical protein
LPKHLKFLTCAIVVLGTLASSSAASAAPLYPDLKTLPPRSLKFAQVDVTGSDSGHTGVRQVLRFSNTVWNAGEGPLVLSAHLDPATKRGQAIQRVYDESGAFTTAPTGSDMYFHPSHNHYHFDGWGAYQLWTAAEYDAWLAGGSTTPEATGTKTTSCVLDEEFVAQLPGARWPGTYNFGGCNPDAQGNLLEGLSVGWGDTYDWWRADQWVELPGNQRLADGQYVLRSLTDPGNVVKESASNDPAREGRASNDSIVRFTVSGGQILDGTAPTGTVMINNVDASTTSPRVTVKVLGRDDVAGVNQFRVSNDGNTWATFAYDGVDSTPSQINWDLSDARYGGTAGGGTKTVHVQFRDASGRWGSTERDTITLEGAPPVSAYAQGVLGDSPVSYWRLGEMSGTTAKDERSVNPGTYVNAPALGGSSLINTDPDNNAVGFNGSSGSVRAAYSSSMNLASAITLEAWIKPSALPAAGDFASIISHPEAYALQFNGAKLEFTVMQGGARKRMQAAEGAIQPGGTYHVVGTYDGTTQRLYINGVEAASGPLTGPASQSSTGLYIGSWDSGSEYFNGVIDEVAVYGSTLSAAKVKQHHDSGRGQQAPPPNAPSGLAATAASDTRVNLTWTDNSADESSFQLQRSSDSSFTNPETITIANDETAYGDTGLTAATTYHYRLRARNAVGFSPWTATVSATTQATPPPPPTGYAAAVVADTPVSYWRLGEASGTSAADQRGANAGTYLGAPGLGAPSLLASDSANKAVAFDGANDAMRATDSNSLDLTDRITLEAWIKPNALPAAGDFASVVTKAEAYSLQFNGPLLELTVMQAGVRKRLQAPAGTIAAGQTYHVVGTYDGTTQRLYVNGAQVASTALTGAASVTATNLDVGSWDGGSEFFNGTIDDVAVYGSALAAARVTAHYDAARATTPPPPPPPTAPAAPSNLGATAVSDTRVDLTWNDNASDETGFVVERSSSSSFATVQSTQLGANVRSWSDTGRTASTTYWYRVRAVNAVGPSGWSNSASATTQAAPTTPPPPTYAQEVAADAPVSWWRLGETSGTTAADERGANGGSYRGGATLGVPSLLATDSANRAVRFDGSNDAVQVNDSSSLDLTNRITLEAWIKPNALPASGVYKSILSKSSAYMLEFRGSQLALTIMQSGVRRILLAPAGTIVAGRTYHVVGTYDGQIQRLYVNGTQVASRAQTGQAAFGTGSLGIAARGGATEYLNGTIDEAAVYNKALSATRISTHARAGGASGGVSAAQAAKRVRLKHRRTRDNLRAKAGRGKYGKR